MSRASITRKESSYLVRNFTIGDLTAAYRLADIENPDPFAPEEVHLVHAGRDLSRTQLASLRYDGALVPAVGSVYAERPLRTPAERSRALALMIEDSWGQDPVFCRWSAAWLYGVSGPPAFAEFLSRLYVHPAKDYRSREFRSYQLNLDKDEFYRVGEVVAISPAQCAAELLIHEYSPKAWVAAAALLKKDGLPCPRKVAQALAATERLGLPAMRRRAQRHLTEWLACSARPLPIDTEEKKSLAAPSPVH
ncbi:hypothetical protein [Micrococcoides hystricis]|uniref:Transcriptional regulator n=1 Tax=Micrococcoides hystricis TaxID=1572761 RepID=A0ABV6P7I9_9MICC